MLIGDVNGDARSDLVVGHGLKELRVFLGIPDPELFTGRPQRVRTEVPIDEEYTWLVDVNADGRDDVLMHHPPDTTGDAHRVTLLLVAE